MAEFGTAKTVFILAIVVGCFAILWPKIFYPMLVTSLGGAPPGGAPVAPQQDSPLDDQANNCCDVIFESDVTAIKVLTAMCGDILHHKQFMLSEQLHLPKASVERCRDEVRSACGLDITAVLRDQNGLTKSYMQILDEIRSYNNSACLKENFGVQLSLIGTPRRMRYFPERYFRDKTIVARHLRPERPAHLHPDMLHPALRQKGRAIPERPITVASATGMDGNVPRPAYPIPGMRPPMGGGGHMVSAPKGSGTMGIVMPLYTVGIVVFFVYTIMKVLFKKQDDRNKAADFGMDPEIRRMMFGGNAVNECPTGAHSVPQQPKRPSPEPVSASRAAPLAAEQANGSATAAANGSAATNGFRGASPPKSSSKLGWNEHDTIVTAISGLLAEVDQHLLASEAKSKVNTAKGDDEEAEQAQSVEEKNVEEQEIEKDQVVTKEDAEVIEKENIEATKEVPPVKEELPEEEVQEVPVEEKVEKLTRVEIEEVKPVEPEPAVEDETPVEEPVVEEPVVEEPLEEEIAKVTNSDEPDPEEETNEALIPTNGHVPERCITPLQQLLEEGGGMVTVLNMETTARCEDGQKMARPHTPSTPPRSMTPILPLYALEQFTPSPAYRWSRPATPTSVTPPLQRPYSATPPPTHGFPAEGHLIGGHGILVSDSECEATPAADYDYDDFDLDEEAPPVILSGKMTLSVINLPEAIAAEAAAAAAAAATSSGQQRGPLSASPIVEATNETNVLKENGDSNFDVNGAEEVSATNYTTASAAAAEDGAGLEETSADVSGLDDQAEALDIDEPAAEIEDLPRDDASAPHNQSNGLQ